MLSLNARKDGFRFILPKEFFYDKVLEKYAKILQQKHSFFVNPVDFVNESIQRISLLGFQNATFQQQQPGHGVPLIDPSRTRENNFAHSDSEYTYRSQMSPLTLIDKSFNVEFRHTLGYINYFILFENFWYQYSRDMPYKDLVHEFNIDLFDQKGVIYSRVVLMNPVIEGMDMLGLDYTAPIAQSDSFKISFRFSNIDYQLIDYTED